MKRIFGVIVILSIVLPLSGQTFGLGDSTPPEVLNKSLDSATAVPGTDRLPSKVDLTSYFPPPGYQDRQNSCVGWATAYAARTYQENRENNWAPLDNSEIFSPSFIYNQINDGRDRGSTIIAAMDLVVNQGSATLATMPYTLNHRQQPSRQARSEASRFTAESFERLDPENIRSIKMQLAQGHPVIFGMFVYDNFMDYKGGIYDRTQGRKLGGHAMCLIGYDDSKDAFRLINSWSDRWGDAGYAWVDYDVFGANTHSAYVLRDKMTATPEETQPPTRLWASAGAREDRIQLSWEEVKNAEGYQVFRSQQPAGGYEKRAEVRGTTYIDNNLPPGTTYYYSVKAVGPGGPSSYSSAAQGFTKKEARELGIPQGLEGFHKEGSLTLMWAPVADADGYYIYRMDLEKENFLRIGQSRDEGYQIEVTQNPTRTERFIITAFSGERESRASNSTSILIEEAEPDFLEPPVLQASQGEYRRQIVIEWDEVKGASSYVVLRWDSFTNSWEILDEVNKPSFTDGNLNFKEEAFYTAVARRGDLLSEAADFTHGWLRSFRPPRRDSLGNDDRNYYNEYNQDIEEKAVKKGALFRDDEFFTDPEEFFGDFREEDFFFFNEEKFFALDEEKFFEVEDDFFSSGDDFF